MLKLGHVLEAREMLFDFVFFFEKMAMGQDAKFYSQNGWSSGQGLLSDQFSGSTCAISVELPVSPLEKTEILRC